MVTDTSALLAILQHEPERRAFNEAIEAGGVDLEQGKAAREAFAHTDVVQPQAHD